MLELIVKHPDAEVIAHPECHEGILRLHTCISSHALEAQLAHVRSPLALADVLTSESDRFVDPTRGLFVDRQSFGIAEIGERLGDRRAHLELPCVELCTERAHGALFEFSDRSDDSILLTADANGKELVRWRSSKVCPDEYPHHIVGRLVVTACHGEHREHVTALMIRDVRSGKSRATIPGTFERPIVLDETHIVVFLRDTSARVLRLVVTAEAATSVADEDLHRDAFDRACAGLRARRCTRGAVERSDPRPRDPG